MFPFVVLCIQARPLYSTRVSLRLYFLSFLCIFSLPPLSLPLFLSSVVSYPLPILFLFSVLSFFSSISTAFCVQARPLRQTQFTPLHGARVSVRLSFSCCLCLFPFHLHLFLYFFLMLFHVLFQCIPLYGAMVNVGLWPIFAFIFSKSYVSQSSFYLSFHLF